MDDEHAKRETHGPDGTSARSSADNPWVVLACLFLGAGALGIPLIWASRAFSRPVKVLLTIVVTLYTALMLWLVWLVIVAFVRQMADAL